MSDKDYFGHNRFRNSLNEFVLEVWDNPHQAARDAGIPYQDLHTTLYGNKKKVLKYWHVNALLNGALYEKKEKFSEERFDYWHSVLHRDLIFINTISAWIYNEKDGRIKDEALKEQAKEHNEVIKQNLAKDFALIENVVNTVYKAGGYTWSFTALYVLVRRTKLSANPENIVIPPDWQISILNAVDVFSGFELPNIEDLKSEDVLSAVRNSPSFLWRVVTRTLRRWFDL